MLNKCLFQCQSPAVDVEESYFRNSMDLKCEDACYTDHLKISKESLNMQRLSLVQDKKEACMTECFIPRKGNTDAQLCMEKCNVDYDKELRLYTQQAREALALALTS